MSLVPTTPPDDDEVEAELVRAIGVVGGLGGREVGNLGLAKIDPKYSRFVAQKVSSLSPLVASLVEIEVVEAINEDADGFEWIRQEPAFPDAAMLSSTGVHLDAGLEVKAWHVLSTEITGRFKESRSRLLEKQISMTVVAWALDRIVWGYPIILGVYFCPAVEFAEARDRHYYNPPRYLVVEPEDTAARTRNLQQTLVEGYLLQETNEHMVDSALGYARAKGDEAMANPYSTEAEELVADLMSRYRYRRETNFAKIDRIDHAGLEGFKSQMMALELHGRSVSSWIRIFAGLGSTNTKTLAEATAAVEALFALP